MPGLAVDTSQLGVLTIIQNIAALPTGGARYSGMEVFQADTGQVKQWDGTGWIIRSEPCQPWAPAFASGIVAGNGVWSWTYYHRFDGWCECHGVFTYGSTSSYSSGAILLNLPVNALATGPADFGVEYGDLSAPKYFRGVSQSGVAASAPMTVFALSPTYMAVAGVNTTSPFTWATGDTLKFSGRYRMSTRYL